MQTHRWWSTALVFFIAACGTASPAAPPKIEIRPSTLELRCLPVGCAREARVRNAGDASVIVGRILVTGPNASQFRHTSACDNKKLRRGEACDLEVVFTPGLSSTSHAQLTVSSRESQTGTALADIVCHLVGTADSARG